MSGSALRPAGRRADVAHAVRVARDAVRRLGLDKGGEADVFALSGVVVFEYEGPDGSLESAGLPVADVGPDSVKAAVRA